VHRQKREGGDDSYTTPRGCLLNLPYSFAILSYATLVDDAL